MQVLFRRWKGLFLAQAALAASLSFFNHLIDDHAETEPNCHCKDRRTSRGNALDYGLCIFALPAFAINVLGACGGTGPQWSPCEGGR